ncbi:2-octaprenyl-6-methoxyphenyl hydroxylase [Testudinibacter sp. P80/BLE/0925]|uniref:2-octaprenyl-6-methoxyphenyl hydroxylase n=1 Tax=Testudinibacter sp. TW-1 TaxID=3417757 RepID=UPI003D370123
MQAQQYDVVIVGGAMSGCCLALALAQGLPELRLAIIEKNPPQAANRHQQKCGFDARSIALSHGSCQTLQQIRVDTNTSLWQNIAPLAEDIRQIHISDCGHAGLVDLSAQELNLSRLGAVVELSAVGAVLLKAIAQQANIDYLAPCTVTQIERSTEKVNLRLSNHQHLETPLLIAADGTQSAVAKQCGIQYQILNDYQQSAVIANVKSTQAHHGRAFERFTAQGPLALLPLKNDRLSLVWCLKQADDVMVLDDQAFLQRLQRQFGWRLGRFEQVGKRVAYPLALQQAERAIHHRLAVIGNAAQTLHPIAGQGFNLGLRDVADLAKVLIEAARQGQDLGESAVLQRYRQRRQADQHNIINLTDGLVNTFANDLLPMQIGRNLGLLGLSHSLALRQQFIKPTLGWV